MPTPTPSSRVYRFARKYLDRMISVRPLSVRLTGCGRAPDQDLDPCARDCALALLGVFAAGAGAAPASPSRTLAAADQLESQVLVELNAIRRQHGLAPVRLSRPLSAAADAHSRAMGTFGFFEHESRDGSAFWKRVQRFYGPDGYEQLVGRREPALVVRRRSTPPPRSSSGWRAPATGRTSSPPRWREIGLSAAQRRAPPRACTAAATSSSSRPTSASAPSTATGLGCPRSARSSVDRATDF